MPKASDTAGPAASVLLDDEEAALSYAVQYGRMLADGKQQGLTI